MAGHRLRETNKFALKKTSASRLPAIKSAP
jgi:hypothetical protein